MPIIPNSFTNTFGGSPVQPSQVSYTSFTLPPDLTLNWPVSGFQTDNVVARVTDLTATQAGTTVTMPPADQVSVGSDVLFRNLGGFDISILDNEGSEIVVVPAAVADVANSVYIIVTDNSSAAGVWGEVAFGATTGSPVASALAGNGLTALLGKLNTNLPITELSSDTYTATSADRAKYFVYTGGQGTFTLPAANLLPNGFYISIANRSADGQLTVNPQGSSRIDGNSNLVITKDQDCIIATDGVNWFTLGLGTLTFFLTNVLRTILDNDATVVLTTTQATNQIQIFSGNQDQDTTVTFPNIYGIYFISNETNASNFVIKVTCLDSGIVTSIPNGERFIFYSDGIDLKFAPTAITDFIFQDGSAADPSITFVSGAGDGYYLANPNELGVAINSTQIASFDEFGIKVVDGTAAAPSYAFLTQNDKGMYSRSANEIGFAANGADVMSCDPTGVNILNGGSAFFFDGDNTQYISLQAPAVLGVTTEYTLPLLPGTSKQALVTDGLDVLSWKTFLPQILQTSLGTPFNTGAIAASTFVNVTGLSVIITPISTSNKILLTVTMYVGADTATTNDIFMRVTRNGTPIGVGTPSASQIAIGAGISPISDTSLNALTWTYLDSPASVAALTYQVQIACFPGSTIYVNRSQADDGSANFQASISTITVQEVLT